MPIDPQTVREFERWGAAPPSSDSHGTEEEIASNMKRLLPNKWHLDGNRLIGETEMGPLVQFIPTDYILTGVDEQGLPMLTKVSVRAKVSLKRRHELFHRLLRWLNKRGLF